MQNNPMYPRSPPMAQKLHYGRARPMSSPSQPPSHFSRAHVGSPAQYATPVPPQAPATTHYPPFPRGQKPMTRLMTYSGLVPAFDETAAATAHARAPPQAPAHDGPGGSNSNSTWKQKYMRARLQQQHQPPIMTPNSADGATGLHHGRSCSSCTAPKVKQ